MLQCTCKTVISADEISDDDVDADVANDDETMMIGMQ